MDGSQFVGAVVSVLIGGAPLILTYLIGVAVALLRWGRHRRSSSLVFVGCGILLVNGIALGIFAAVLPQYLIQRGWRGADFGGVFIIVNLFRSVVSSIGIGFLLYAAFDRRSQYYDEGEPS